MVVPFALTRPLTAPEVAAAAVVAVTEAAVAATEAVVATTAVVVSLQSILTTDRHSWLINR